VLQLLPLPTIDFFPPLIDPADAANRSGTLAATDARRLRLPNHRLYAPSSLLSFASSVVQPGIAQIWQVGVHNVPSWHGGPADGAATPQFVLATACAPAARPQGCLTAAAGGPACSGRGTCVTSCVPSSFF
jgi:hypothetical protein